MSGVIYCELWLEDISCKLSSLHPHCTHIRHSSAVSKPTLPTTPTRHLLDVLSPFTFSTLMGRTIFWEVFQHCSFHIVRQDEHTSNEKILKTCHRLFLPIRVDPSHMPLTLIHVLGQDTPGASTQQLAIKCITETVD